MVVESDSLGRFVFPEVPAGQFRLKVRKDSFLREEYPGILGDGPGVPITLGPGDAVRDIVFALEPAPTISGTIRDRGNAPVQGAEVRALKRIFTSRGERALALAASTRTDDLGRYRLYWLDAGEYLVVGMPPPPAQTSADPRAPASNEAPTYFPGVTDVDYAKPVRLDARLSPAGIDFKLAYETLLGVRVVVESATAEGSPMVEVIVAAPEDGAGIARFKTRALLNVSAIISGIPPGSYILSAFTANEWTSTRIVLRPGSRVPLDFRLRITPGITIPGRIQRRLNTPRDLESLKVRLVEVDTALPEPPPAGVLPDDRFAVAGVQPGTYFFHVDGVPPDLYVESATFARADALTNPISITGGMLPEQLQISLSDDGGEIRGVVLDGNGQRFTAAQVTLIPAGSRSLLRYRTTVSDMSGAFRLTGVAPGEYLLFAWRNLPANAHMNAEHMRPYESVGTPLQVQAKSMSTVRLPLLDAPQ
jgi:hypothetical protein